MVTSCKCWKGCCDVITTSLLVHMHLVMWPLAIKAQAACPEGGSLTGKPFPLIGDALALCFKVHDRSAWHVPRLEPTAFIINLSIWFHC